MGHHCDKFQQTDLDLPRELFMLGVQSFHLLLEMINIDLLFLNICSILSLDSVVPIVSYLRERYHNFEDLGKPFHLLVGSVLLYKIHQIPILINLLCVPLYAPDQRSVKKIIMAFWSCIPSHQDFLIFVRLLLVGDVFGSSPLLFN